MPLPTVILPGYLASAIPYRDMEQGLQDLGLPVVTVPLKRRDWFPTVGGRSMTPILERLDRTVNQMMEQYGCDRINLIGHSAGGWIARIYLGEVPYQIHPSDTGKSCLWKAHPCISTLMTLGTPHISQERWTKRNLDFVKNNYPGAFHPTVRYICVAGKALFGERVLFNRGTRLNVDTKPSRSTSSFEAATPGEPWWDKWFAYSSYELTCGQGDCWGDGITPIQAAHLEGAENLVLEGVFHSPRPGRYWYGSPDVLNVWASYLI